MKIKKKAKMKKAKTKSVGRPRGRSPRHTIHTTIDVAIGERLKAYLEGFEFRPRLKEVIELALVEFLDRRGEKRKPKDFCKSLDALAS